MIRTLITPYKQNILIKVPENFIGKQVEVIAFTIDEAKGNGLKNDAILTHLASEKSLAKDWLNPEEDKAWKDL